MAAYELCVCMQTIVTPTLTLEPLLASHAEEMFELLSDPAIYQYLDYTAPVSVGYLRGIYQRWEARQSPDASEAWLNWVIRPRDQPLAGYVQATVASNRSAHVAYILASKYWGRGYAGVAVEAMLEHVASAYEVDRYMATVEVGNQRSIRLLERLGFYPTASHDLLAQRLSATERMFVRVCPKGAPNADA
jgi:ribosomal-protein-alanine N-acetyltransferase